jgi:CRP-like cAMP-binding protein
MFVLLKGQAKVMVDEVLVELAEPGAILGELALIDHEPRSASVQCVEDCDFAEVDEKRFRYLVQQTPYFALEVMKVLGQRLRRTDKML